MRLGKVEQSLKVYKHVKQLYTAAPGIWYSLAPFQLNLLIKKIWEKILNEPRETSL